MGTHFLSPRGAAAGFLQTSPGWFCQLTLPPGIGSQTWSLVTETEIIDMCCFKFWYWPENLRRYTWVNTVGGRLGGSMAEVSGALISEKPSSNQAAKSHGSDHQENWQGGGPVSCPEFFSPVNCFYSLTPVPFFWRLWLSHPMSLSHPTCCPDCLNSQVSSSPTTASSQSIPIPVSLTFSFFYK